MKKRKVQIEAPETDNIEVINYHFSIFIGDIIISIKLKF